MKYIKRFETYGDPLRYKENDYVIINTPEGEKVGQITNVKHLYADIWPYEVTIANSYKDSFMRADSEIVRFAMPEEIEQYELEKNAYNYNL